LTFAQEKIQSSYARDLSASEIAKARTVDSSMMEMRDLLQHAQGFPSEEAPAVAEDHEDYTVLHYGRSCTIRGRQVVFDM
jgi:hypothetical protein